VWSADLLATAEMGAAAFALCSLAKNICCGEQPASVNVSIDRLGQVQQAISEFAVGENFQSGEN
jgi:hypothetical protein